MLVVIAELLNNKDIYRTCTCPKEEYDKFARNKNNIAGIHINSSMWIFNQQNNFIPANKKI